MNIKCIGFIFIFFLQLLGNTNLQDPIRCFAKVWGKIHIFPGGGGGGGSECWCSIFSLQFVDVKVLLRCYDWFSTSFPIIGWFKIVQSSCPLALNGPNLSKSVHYKKKISTGKLFYWLLFVLALKLPFLETGLKWSPSFGRNK